MMSLDEVASLVSYDPETGIFRWAVKSRPGCRFGDECGTYDKNGYRALSLNGKKMFAHRVAWLFVHGEWPFREIDHINGVRDDNRISNLRLATHQENTRNMRLSRLNTSGFKGVCYDKSRGKWIATISVARNHKNLGRFDTKEAAAAAYNAAAIREFGQFARIN